MLSTSEPLEEAFDLHLGFRAWVARVYMPLAAYQLRGQRFPETVRWAYRVLTSVARQHPREGL